MIGSKLLIGCLRLSLAFGVAAEELNFKLGSETVLPAPPLLEEILIADSATQASEATTPRQELKLYQENGALKINISHLTELSDAQTEAINSELMMYFMTEVEVAFINNAFGIDWFSTVEELSYYTQLYAFGINREYLLYNNRNKKFRTFKNLDEAVTTLTTLNGLTVAELSHLPPSPAYRVRVRQYLDIWRLPAALLLEVLSNPEWDINKEWNSQIFYTENPYLPSHPTEEVPIFE